MPATVSSNPPAQNKVLDCPNQLLPLLGLTLGSPLNRANHWLAYEYLGQPRLIAAQPVCYNLSYQQLQEARLINSRHEVEYQGRVWRVSVPSAQDWCRLQWFFRTYAPHQLGFGQLLVGRWNWCSDRDMRQAVLRGGESGYEEEWAPLGAIHASYGFRPVLLQY